MESISATQRNVLQPQTVEKKRQRVQVKKKNRVSFVAESSLSQHQSNYPLARMQIKATPPAPQQNLNKAKQNSQLTEKNSLSKLQSKYPLAPVQTKATPPALPPQNLKKTKQDSQLAEKNSLSVENMPIYHSTHLELNAPESVSWSLTQTIWNMYGSKGESKTEETPEDPSKVVDITRHFRNAPVETSNNSIDLTTEDAVEKGESHLSQIQTISNNPLDLIAEEVSDESESQLSKIQRTSHNPVDLAAREVCEEDENYLSLIQAISNKPLDLTSEDVSEKGESHLSQIPESSDNQEDLTEGILSSFLAEEVYEENESSLSIPKAVSDDRLDTTENSQSSAKTLKRKAKDITQIPQGFAKRDINLEKYLALFNPKKKQLEINKAALVAYSNLLYPPVHRMKDLKKIDINENFKLTREESSEDESAKVNLLSKIEKLEKLSVKNRFLEIREKASKLLGNAEMSESLRERVEKIFESASYYANIYDKAATFLMNRDPIAADEIILSILKKHPKNRCFLTLLKWSFNLHYEDLIKDKKINSSRLPDIKID